MHRSYASCICLCILAMPVPQKQRTPKKERLSNETICESNQNAELEAQLSKLQGQSPIIAAGCKHSVGLSENGALATAGWNQDGQCDLRGWTDIVAITAGDFFTIGLKADGTVLAVGFNDKKQCDVSHWRLWE